MTRYSTLSSCFVIALIAGCDYSARPLYDLEPASEPSVVEPDRFEAASTGTIRGRVLWSGALPDVPPFESVIPKAGEPVSRILRPNPNVHDINDLGVAGAVIFLRGVDPRAARPWDHPPVRIELSDEQIAIRQGQETLSNIGIIRLGESFEAVAVEPGFHGLRGRGDDFFTHQFPDTNRPPSRKPPRKGIIELSSSAQHFWQRAYLFVDDHPYYTRTGRDGSFSLSAVPPGDYEVVCWLPNWKEAGRDRDPESSRISRLRYGPPVEESCSVQLDVRAEAVVEFTLCADRFP